MEGRLIGYGSGYGYGYGDGDGYGSGSGSGDGDGYGSGSSSGSGDGSGDGYGYGDGDGYGYGYGDGSGDGSGCGSGEPIASLSGHDVHLLAPWSVVKVGCQAHSLDHWRNNWQSIAEREGVKIAPSEVNRLLELITAEIERA